MIRVIFLALLLFLSYSVNADNIAFGTVKGIKIYDDTNDKSIRIHFNDSAVRQEVEGCGLVAKITFSLHEKEVVDRMLSLVMTAYISGKKIRAYSFKDNCEADFLSLQETYF